MKKALEPYMCWQPHKLVMYWFGPCFRKRAFALLLVCQRMAATYPRLLAPLMSPDVLHLLVKYLARVEYLYVPYASDNAGEDEPDD